MNMFKNTTITKKTITDADAAADVDETADETAAAAADVQTRHRQTDFRNRLNPLSPFPETWEPDTHEQEYRVKFQFHTVQTFDVSRTPMVAVVPGAAVTLETDSLECSYHLPLQASHRAAYPLLQATFQIVAALQDW